MEIARTRTKVWLITLAALATIGSAGCSVNPITGRPSVVLTPRASEVALSEEADAKVQAMIGLYDDAGLKAYLEEIGRRLTRQFESDTDFEFRIVDLELPNAFALPGGQVYVSRGLLTLVHSEDELANVIGHEVGHVVGRHSGERVTLSAPFKIATGLGSFVTGIVSPRLSKAVSAIGGLTGGLIIAPYSRRQEREADELGQELASRAGWDPMALPRFLESLAAEGALHGERAQSFLDSHPGTLERVESTAAHGRGMTPTAAAAIADSEAAFLRKLDGLLVGVNPAKGVFIGTSFLHPAMSFSIDFPKGWQTQNQPSAVLAQPTDGSALSILRIAGEGDDPMQVARYVAKQIGGGAAASRLTVNGLPAARVRTDTGGRRDPSWVHITWIAYRGAIYSVTNVTTPERENEYKAVFNRLGNSFAPLSPERRASIRAIKLRFIEAREGETLPALIERSGSPWSAERAAVANRIDADAPLEAGAKIRLGLPERYDD